MSAPAARAPGADDSPRLADLTASLLRHGRDLAADYALLAVLDARSAAVRFGWLVAAGLVAAVLVATAWLALVVAAVVALTGNGASWGAALGLAGAVNVLGAAGLVLWMRGRMRDLPFAATLRQLRGEPAREAADEP
jgi:Putative Actinobacterial Holin-X, holin superfamily III